MIIAIDAGNTNIVLGCLDEETIYFTARISTDRLGTQDEYAVKLQNMLALNHVDVQSISGGIISSVVPALRQTLRFAVEKITGKSCLVVGAGLKTGLNILIDNPAQLGSDLVVDAVAAIAEYPAPMVVIDMGTATTLAVIDKNKNYLGGMIMPGAMIALDALSAKTSQLPYISLEAPKQLIGSNTQDCMKSGVLYGNAAMLDGLILRVREEVGALATVLATGGLAQVILPFCREAVQYDGDLMLKGLYLIYKKNVR